MRFFKTLTLTVVALFAMTTACLAAPPPLFSDSRGHGEFMEQFEYIVNSAENLGTRVLSGRPCDNGGWQVNLSTGVAYVNETNGAVTSVDVICYRPIDAINVTKVIFAGMLDVNFNNPQTVEHLNFAIDTVQPNILVDGVVQEGFVDYDSGRTFVILKRRVAAHGYAYNMFTIVRNYQ